MKKVRLLALFFLISLNLFSQNNSLHFDGIDDIIIGPSDPILELTEGTVELWVKPQSKTTSQTFICYRDNTGSQTRFLWNFLPDLSGIGYWNGSLYNTLNYQFNAGQWYHLALVGSTNSTEVYVNGSHVGGFAISFGFASGDELKLVMGNDVPLTEFFHGEMDEVRIWNKKLCQEEIMNGMSCSASGNEPGLVANYTFNQGNPAGNNSLETALKDSTPNNLDCTLTNFTLNGSISNWVNSSNGVAGNCNSISCPPSHQIQIYYLITSDYSFVQAEYDEIQISVKEIQGWYQAQMGGKTFHLANSESPIIVNLPNNSVYYNADYWGRVQNDMISLGHSSFTYGKINVYFIKGGGGVALGAQGCGVDCGLAMFGMDIYPQFNTGQYFNCPNAPGGVAAFPCTPLGATTHEIGHCFGLSHPIDDTSTSAVANHSVMQTHWNYPYNFAPPSESPWGLLSLERQSLYSNPFFFDDINLYQKNEDLPIVNLPNTGTSPVANFTYSISDKSITLTNISSNNIASYWTFGDENISHETTPYYTYNNYGTYTLRLRVLNSNGMMAIKEETINITCQKEVIVDYIPINLDTISADSSISTLNSVIIPGGDSVVFKAGACVILNSGFLANVGSDFHAYIDGCSQSNILTYNSTETLAISDVVIPINFEDPKRKNIFQLFPNPTNGIFKVSGNRESKIKIFDSYGKLIFQQKNIDQEIDISKHPDGLYFVLFEAESNQIEKILKIEK